MKNLFALFLIATFLGMSACAQKVDLDAEKAKVKSVIDQLLIQVWETEDIELLSKITAHDPDMVTFGTDSAEHFVGWEPLRNPFEKQFAAYENTKVSVSNHAIKVHDSGNVAWFSAIWNMSLVAGGQPASLKDCRVTGVLEKRNGNWVIVQSHYSIPVSGQATPY